MAISSRCHLSPAQGRRRRIRLAKSWPNLSAHRRTVSWLTTMPRAGGQHLLDHAQAEREAEIQPDGVADDLGWKAVAGIGRLGGRRAHFGSLPGRAPSAKPRST